MAQALRITCLACEQANRVPAERLAQGPKCGTCGARLADGAVRAIDPRVLEKAKGDDLPLLVDFWAPWCGPCRAMAPEFARAAERLAPRVRLAKIDTEAHPAAAQRHSIRGIPALVLWRRGRELARLAGARPAAEIADFALGRLSTTA